MYSLIPIEDFKALMGVDDREDRISRFCLVTATLTIEQYCKRKLLRKKHIERLEFYGDLVLPLAEYPVQEILAVYIYVYGNEELLEPEFYDVIPDCGTDSNLPFNLNVSSALNRRSGLKSLRAYYYAGYSPNKIPADLASACMELAAWNLNRYRGRHIGFTGNVKGNGREGQHFEMSMPENVRSLLEPYRRKVI